MSKKSKKEKKAGLLKGLKSETLHAVGAVVFFAIGVFFTLSAFGYAGIVGDVTYQFFHALLGIGYFLLPLLCFVLVVALIRSVRPDFALPTFIGSLLFLLSGLGLVEMIFGNDSGGILGTAVAFPFFRFFDIYAGMVLLFALFIISLLFIFDTKPNVAFLHNWYEQYKLKREENKQRILEMKATQMEKSNDTQDAPDVEPVIHDPSRDNETEEKTPPMETKPSKKEAKKAEQKKEEDEIEDSLKKFSFGDTTNFIAPPLSLLEKDKGKPGAGDIKANMNVIKRTLQNFGIAVEMAEVSVGPSVTRYALKPAEGVKLSRIVGLQNELALALAAHPVRVEAPIPSTSLVGIEIPNNTKAMVGLQNLLSSNESKIDKPLLVSLGRGISGKPKFADLAKMPHLLVAGATGSGKSVTANAMILSLLFRNPPENLRLLMVDPKRVELTLYNGIPHLLTPVITDPKKAILALKWAVKEMSRRYDVLEEHQVRDIKSYHENVFEVSGQNASEEDGPERMPYIVIIIDELADLMQIYPRELEAVIVRLAQMSRAVGIHLVLSTQRPSVNVITGLIKANVPARVSLQVASQVDSRTILDTSGAEKLLGAGDMLFMSGEMSRPERLQSAFVSEAEVKRIVKFLKDRSESIPDEINFTEDSTKGDAVFEATMNNDEDDELYEEAREAVVSAGKASTSYLQRKLRIGYSRAARLIDLLEERGIIGPADGSRPREIIEGMNTEPLDEGDTSEDDSTTHADETRDKV